MATITEIENSVRKRVADFTGTQKYGAEYYADAIDFARKKLNHDLKTSYATVDAVPDAQSFLIVKLATIEMALIRATEGAEGEDTSSGDGEFSSITVPDLTVESGDEGTYGPGYWLKLVEKLQSEYDDEIETEPGSQGEIEEGVLRRISLTNRGYRKRVLDEGLPATTLGTPVVSGGNVSLSWTIILAEDFLSYEVYRDTDITMVNEEIVRIEPDNHELEYIDTGLTAGTYYYRVKVVNRNDLRTSSAVVSATVT